MMRDIEVYLHGSSHFMEHHNKFQTKFLQKLEREERMNGQKRFKDVSILARGGKRFDDRFRDQISGVAKGLANTGIGQIHLVGLGDNDIRKFINDKRSPEWIATNLAREVEDLACFLAGLPNTFLIVMSPLPCPSYGSLDWVWIEVENAIREAIRPFAAN
ncbi:MAG: hypothetical protein FJ333_05395, partial [Sphingomonadales bacterium]|nr:hypothetical protein [Sphingomonadales bacterium]